MAKKKDPKEYVASQKVTTFNRGDLPNKKGAFMLGYVNPFSGKFRPRYVGSSYTDLIEEIFKSGERDKNKTFKRFRYEITNTDIQAWKLECKLYHDLKETNNLTNERHPKRPEGYTVDNLKCPENCGE
jgi:hypothetical protein